MWPFQSTQEYHAIVTVDEGSKDGFHEPVYALPKSKGSQTRPIVVGATALLIGTILVTAVVFAVQYSLVISPSVSLSANEDSQDTLTITKSGKCPKRREWRSLNQAEQQEYISAVLCLKDLPSTLSPTSNFNAYDDFPWLHAHVGYATHHSAPFLHWHRYFLHIYEETLKSQCGYAGSLVYWDWTQDYQALERSPVFDPNTGFGGDGNVDGEITVGRTGRCVIDGPFARNAVPFYDVKYQPHCLSRGFRNLKGELGHIDGEDVSPGAIEEVLISDTYETFVEKMESKIHDVIPFGIAGDFETFTAPYDPIFFLHHTQLDRLWWIWQQAQPDHGLTLYGGHKHRHSIESAHLSDELHYRGLAADVKVQDVMDIESELLCYQY